MEYLNVFIPRETIPVLAWGWRFATGLSIASAAGSGSNPRWGKGQRFALRFPPDRQEQSDVARAPVVVLIEDSAPDVILVRRALELHEVECDVEVLGDGEQAFEFLDALNSSEATCPELLIVDLNLPKQSGLDVLRRVRDNPKCNPAKVMVLSSSGAQQDKDAAARLGADIYIRKPTRLGDFLQLGATIKTFLKPRREM